MVRLSSRRPSPPTTARPPLHPASPRQPPGSNCRCYTHVCAEILTRTGTPAKITSDRFEVAPASDWRPVVPDQPGGRIRATPVMAAGLLARAGQVRFPLPGGDAFTHRLIDRHLAAMEAAGATLSVTASHVEARLPVPGAVPFAVDVMTQKWGPSLGATVTAMLLAARARHHPQSQQRAGSPGNRRAARGRRCRHQVARRHRTPHHRHRSRHRRNRRHPAGPPGSHHARPGLRHHRWSRPPQQRSRRDLPRRPGDDARRLRDRAGPAGRRHPRPLSRRAPACADRHRLRQMQRCPAPADRIPDPGPGHLPHRRADLHRPRQPRRPAARLRRRRHLRRLGHHRARPVPPSPRPAWPARTSGP